MDREARGRALLLRMGGPEGMMPGGFGAAAEGTPLRRYDFILQFAWVPTVPSDTKPEPKPDAAAGN